MTVRDRYIENKRERERQREKGKERERTRTSTSERRERRDARGIRRGSLKVTGGRGKALA